jgi:hypothetical protein
MMMQKMLTKIGFEMERVFGVQVIKEGIAFADNI